MKSPENADAKAVQDAIRKALMQDPQKGKSEGVLAITNTQSTKVRLTLEPWADEHVMAPGKTVEVSYSGPSGGRIEIELKPEEMILYGWEGSVLSVRDGGKMKEETARHVFAVVIPGWFSLT